MKKDARGTIFMGAIKSAALFSFTIFSILSLFPQLTYAANLDELEKQKNEAEQKASDLKQQAAHKQSAINTINDLIDKLTNDIAKYQGQIATTQKNIVSTETGIAETEVQIQQKQAELEFTTKKQTEAIQTMYVAGRKSTIENLITSSSLSQTMARQQYLTALSEKIESMMRQIKALKKELETKRESLKQRRLELSVQKEQLVAYQATIIEQKNQQKTLLSGAAAEKAALLNAAKQADQEVHRISSAIFAERQRLIGEGNEIITTGGGGYPFQAIDVADPWGFYTRECTSYAAWYWNSVLGRKWYRVAGYGDAWGWPQAAPSNGVSAHSTPVAGAIISWARIPGTMPYGHVAIVHKVNPDGTINISEYNYVSPHVYSFRENVNPGAYGSHSYIY